MKSRRVKGSLGLPFAIFPALGYLLLAAGCADVTGDALQQDVSQLRQDVNALKVSAHRGRGEAEAISQLERRSRDQSAETTRQLTQLSTRLEALSAELNRVSTRLEDVSRRLDTVSRQSPQSRPVAPPPRAAAPPAISAPPAPATPAPPPAAPLPPAAVPPPAARATPPSISSTAPAPPPAVAPPATTPPAGPAPPPRATPPLAPGRPVAGATAEESYQAAYLDFSRGRYELAMTGFRELLRRYPDSPLADSAQYGIGESYYSMAGAAIAQGQTDKATRALEQSVQEFRKVIVIYPRGAKVPPALYKEALALTELKQTGLARSRLQYLVDHFPQSEEAPLAKERLAALKQ